MSSYTPHAPRTAGLEWLAADSPYTIDAQAKVLCGRIISSAAETVDDLALVPRSVSGTLKCAVDLYEAGSEAIGTRTSVSQVPTTNTGRSSYATGSYWLNQSASGTIAYTDINDSTEDVNYAYTNSYGATLAFRSVGTTLTSKRILRISVTIRHKGTTPGDPAGCLVISGVEYRGTPVWIYPLSYSAYQNTTWDWDLNPATGNPWTLAEANLLIGASATDSFGVQPGGNYAVPGNYTVSGMTITVVYATENRVMTGTFTPVAGSLNTVSMITPAGADTYSKLNGTNLTVAIRRISGSGTVTLGALDSGQSEPGIGYGYQPTLLAETGVSEISGAISVLGDAVTRLPQWALELSSAGTYSVDSQVYQSAVFSSATLNRVYSTRKMAQEVTPTATATYVVVRAMVALLVDNIDTPDLLIKIKKRSDDSQLGSTVTISAEDLVAPRTVPQTITALLSSGAALVTGTQYYIEFSCATGTSNLCWVIPYLTTYVTTAGIVAKNMGGTTDRATLADSSEYDQADIPAYVGQQPAALSSLSAVLV